jgi:hypothetical protein
MLDSAKNILSVVFGAICVDWSGINLARPYVFTPHEASFRELVGGMVDRGLVYSEGHPIGMHVKPEKVGKYRKAMSELIATIKEQLVTKEFKCTLPNGSTVTVNSSEFDLWTRDYAVTEGIKPEDIVVNVSGNHRSLAYMFADIIRRKLDDCTPLADLEISIHTFASPAEIRETNIQENTLRNRGVTKVKQEHILHIAVQLIKKYKYTQADLGRVGLAKGRGALQKLHGAAMLAIKVPDLDLLRKVADGEVKYSSLDKEKTRALHQKAEGADAEQMAVVVAEATEYVNKGGGTKASNVLTRGDIIKRKDAADIVIIASELRTVLKEDTEADRERLELIQQDTVAQAINEFVFQLENGNDSVVKTLLADRAARLAKAAG